MATGGLLNQFSSTIEHSSLLGTIIRAANVIIDVVFITSGQILTQQQASEAVIRAAIQNQTLDIDTIVNGALNDITSTINASTHTILSTSRDLTQTVNRNIQNSTLEIGSQVSTLETTLVAEVQSNRGILNSVLEVLGAGLNVEITNNIVVEDSLLTSLTETVNRTLKSSGAIVNATIDRLGGIFGAVIDGILNIFLKDTLDDKKELIDIAEAILVNKPLNKDVLDMILDEGQEGVGWKIINGVMVFIADKLKISVDDLKAATRDVDLGDFATSIDMFCKTPKIEVDSFLNEFSKDFMLWIADVISNLMYPFVLSQAISLRCLAVWSRDNPWKVLEPGDIANMRHLGLLTDNDALIIMKMNGYSSGDAQLLLNSAQTIPNVEFILTMWLRDILTDDASDVALEQLGYNRSYADAVKKIAFFIPPVQDLITMSVREVFDPVIRAEFGQDENFPEEFANWAKQQGVTREWAGNYWAAHWVLPSIQMGFEMLHRDVIDEPKLRQLMQALDIMPGWVDELIKISFQPITRIDIRRLNRVGLLDGDDLVRRYLDIGYSPADAGFLAEFTEKLNEEDVILDFGITEDLTRSNVIRFYVDGIIDRELAFVTLVNMRIHPIAAGLFLQDADFRMERRERKFNVDLVFDKFRFAGLSLQEATNQLNAIGLAALELQLALLDLEKIRVSETKLPSRADLDKFMQKDIIGSQEYLDVMERIGYSATWANRYMALADKGRT